jgi:hypothetical protein
VATQSSPAVYSNAACVEPEEGSWGEHDPDLELHRVQPAPFFVLQVCNHKGDVCCREGKIIDWVLHWRGARVFDRIVYSVWLEEAADGSRVEAYAASSLYRPRHGSRGPEISGKEQIAAALIAACDEW